MLSAWSVRVLEVGGDKRASSHFLQPDWLFTFLPSSNLAPFVSFGDIQYYTLSDTFSIIIALGFYCLCKCLVCCPCIISVVDKQIIQSWDSEISKKLNHVFIHSFRVRAYLWLSYSSFPCFTLSSFFLSFPNLCLPSCLFSAILNYIR